MHFFFSLTFFDRIAARFETLVSLRSFEDRRNRLPFRPIEPLSIDAYADTITLCLLFLRRHSLQPLHGVPVVRNDVQHALQQLVALPNLLTVHTVLTTVFSPQPLPPVARSDDLLSWYVCITTQFDRPC